MKSTWEATIWENGRVRKETFIAESKPEYGQEKNVINLYPEDKQQTWEGFGGSLTEAPAYLFSTMPEHVQRELLDAYYSPGGLEYTLGRISLDSCDAALGNYSAITEPIPPDALTLPGFSLERDEWYILPLLRRIWAIRPLELMLSPWSPPWFMKTNGERNHGGSLRPEYRKLWAAYFVRYIQEYEKRGIHISSLSVQNEPAAVQTWDSCIVSAEEEKSFIREELAPALKQAELDVDIYIWDHNKERAYERTRTVMDTDDMYDLVSGVAFHWYSGDHFESLQYLAEWYPELKLRFSEGCVEYSVYGEGAAELDNARMFGHEICRDMNAGTSSFITWSIVFDQDGGPNHVNNLCDAPILYDTATKTLHRTLSYEYIGHFSRYIVPGSEHIRLSKFSDDLDATAFLRPDGSIAVVIMNRTSEMKRVFIRLEDEVIMIRVAGDAIVSGIIE